MRDLQICSFLVFHIWREKGIVAIKEENGGRGPVQRAMSSDMTPTRNALLSPLRTPGSAGSPDPSLLVERLQALKSRLSNMTQTLEESVAAASPLRGKANEEILYSTPKLVTQLLEGPLGQDASLFLAPGEAVAPGVQVTEVRFTLAGASDEEIEAIIELLNLPGL